MLSSRQVKRLLNQAHKLKIKINGGSDDIDDDVQFMTPAEVAAEIQSAQNRAQQRQRQQEQRLQQHDKQPSKQLKKHNRRYLPSDDDDDDGHNENTKRIQKKRRVMSSEDEEEDEEDKNDEHDEDEEDNEEDDDIAKTMKEEERTTNDSYQELNTTTVCFSNRLFLETVFEKVESDCKSSMTFTKSQFNKRGRDNQFEEMFDEALVDTLLAHCGGGKRETPIEKHPTTRPAIRNAIVNTLTHDSFIYIAYNPTHLHQPVVCTFQGVKNYLQQLLLGFIIYEFPKCISAQELHSRHHVRPNEVVDIKYVCSSTRIGGQIMLHLMNNMKNRGKRLFILEEASRNGEESLIHFYNSLGFVHVEGGTGAIRSWKNIRADEEQYYMIRLFSKHDDTIIKRQKIDRQ